MFKIFNRLSSELFDKGKSYYALLANFNTSFNMTELIDYEVLSILGSDISSTSYKVRNKRTLEIVVWKALNYEDLEEEGREQLLAKINNRKSLKHPNLLRFDNYILHIETNTLYLVTECCKYGSLFDIFRKCIKNDVYLNEDFIWRILYKIAYTLKNVPQLEGSAISTSNIYVDSKYNLKFYCFNTEDQRECNKMNLFENVLHQMCTLRCDSDKSSIPTHYSGSLRDLCAFLSETSDLEKAVDAILHHPTVLLTIAQEHESEAFTKKSVEVAAESKATCLKARLENIRNREMQLRIHEDRLKERESNVDKREKKIALLERTVRQKLTQAELYLRRSREMKSTRSFRYTTKLNYKQTDTSFSADCGDSIILPTSKKIQPDEITKPLVFTRTLSEKRVKFKGHSPLKDIHNIPNKNSPKYRHGRDDNKHISRLKARNTEVVEMHNENTGPGEKLKKRFSLMSVFSKISKTSSDEATGSNIDNTTKCDIKSDIRPISWTEENKRQAFDLLRIMNGEHEGKSIGNKFKQTNL